MDSSEATAWTPNQELLEMLTGMGISKIAAEHALFCTGNTSAEAAASYVFDNPDLLPVEIVNAGDAEAENELLLGRYKMVFVVNMELGMGVGKTAAQVAHACLGLYRFMKQQRYMNNQLQSWEDYGEKKIVLKGENAAHLDSLNVQCKEKNMPSYLVHDAGHTEVPANSKTVLVVFGEESVVDGVTGSLSLLRD